MKEFPKYGVDKNGNIYSKNCDRYLIPFKQNSGYVAVDLQDKDIGLRKYYLVHRPVAKYWIPNPENKPYVNHKDLNKTNNSADNLEWVTNSENVIHFNNIKKGIIFN